MNKRAVSILCLSALLLHGLTAGDDLLNQLRKPRQLCSTEAASRSDWLEASADKHWAQIPESANFIIADSLWVPAMVKTTLQVVHDDNALYFRAVLAEPDMDNLQEREKFDIWKNDTFEMMLQPPDGLKENFWYHLAISCAAQKYWAREREITEMPGHYESEGIPAEKLPVRVALRADHWEVRATIPRSELPNVTDWNGSWRINFGRGRRVPYGFSCWNKTKAFQDYRQFGILLFGNPDRAIAAEKSYAEALDRFQNQKAGLIAQFRTPCREWKYAFGAASNYRPLNQAYQETSGYGWLEAGIKEGSFADIRGQLPERMRNHSMGDLLDHYAFADTANTGERVIHNFRVDLPNGQYRVHVIAGLIHHERIPHLRSFLIRAQNQPVIEFHVGNLIFNRHTFPVEVQDRKLILTFDAPRKHQDRPETAAYAAGDREKFFIPGWLLNAIVIYPVSERRLSEQQLAIDTLALTRLQPEELVHYREIITQDPEPEVFPESDVARGFTLFSRPLGERLYPGSRPQPTESRQSLHGRAVPGEPLNLPFGFLPHRDLEWVQIQISGLDWLTVAEAHAVAWPLQAGDYAMEPWFLDEYRFSNKDMYRGSNRFLWLQGKVPQSTLPGRYQVFLSVQPNGEGTSRIPLEIEVLPIGLQKNDFVFGGYNPAGYGRPGRSYEDLLAQACARYDLHLNTIYVHPEQEESWQQFEQRLQIYQDAGCKGPFIVYVYLPLEKVDTPLRQKKIDRIPDWAVDLQLQAAERLVKRMQKPGCPRLLYTAMDEAHCKGEPYWSEQIRLLSLIRSRFPKLGITGSESERSFRRSAAAMDFPMLFEVADFNSLELLPGQTLWCYPNQAMLEPADINAGRFCTGWLPAQTPLKAVMPWMLFHAHHESGLRGDPWLLLLHRGVGGYRYVPRLTTIMAQIGMWDLYYGAVTK